MSTTSKRSRGPQDARSEVETTTSRQRQSLRDEQIRKKVEQGLSKRRHTGLRSSKRNPGTVSSLRPAQALTVPESMTVLDAAQMMAAKRADSILVVDEDDHLSGIFTAKDLAYRVVAEGLDARHCIVSEIMTRGPMCVTADTSANDALSLMVQRGFRHLPVCNEEGDIFGLLDITKCLYEAIDKMERAFGSSKKLYDALEGVEREWNNGPVQLMQYMEVLRERMSCPDLSSVLAGSEPVEVTVRTNVRDVAKLMKTHHTTAVLVMESSSLAGIFTSKDIVLRVIAAGLNPETCSVVRVMTPQPDTATPETSIMEALRKMHDGHYLNLPVVDELDQVIGVIDVLKLTWATMEQINSIEGTDTDGGPIWNKFWSSFGEHEATESESVLSDPTSASGLPIHDSSPHTPSPSLMRAASPTPHITFSALANFPEITPNESASVVQEEIRSAVSSSQNKPTRPGINLLEQPTDTFTFKFKSLNGKVHRITARYTSFDALRDLIRQKIFSETSNLSNSFAHVGHDGTLEGAAIVSSPQEEEYRLAIYYEDDEGDQVAMTCDEDLRDSVTLAKKQGLDRVLLFVKDAYARDTEDKAENDFASATQVLAASTLPEIHRPAVDDDQASTKGSSTPIHAGSSTPSPRIQRQRELLTRGNSLQDAKPKKSQSARERERLMDDNPLPFPKEYLLPGAIAFLGVVIIGVFIASRGPPPPPPRRY
ncbi:hypothetical protein BZG36_04830 [Bifiguratus adelaidae]|uniref:CBS domain-containing protein n=1 Tax=Bifiguratus adelaidae TaxID=1938954 RepID=A0A261XVP2_9FUNG|nr:hypothetical protein BZG36_04830 [Bifiguratus adelaidae]